MDTSKKYRQLIKFIEELPNVQYKKTFIFTTRRITSEIRMKKDYEIILKLLENKGFTIINDFNVKGFNTISILKCIVEMNSSDGNHLP